MKLLLFGANGDVGRRIAEEALERGHEVTGASRSGADPGIDNPGFTAVEGDAADPDSVAELAEGHDAVGSAVGPDEDPESLIEAARGLIEGLRRADVDRLVVVGGGGTLEVEPGVDLVDTEDFPDEVRPYSIAHRDALELLEGEADDLEWTFFAPPILLEPGERTGEFRLGEEEVLFDEEGESRISMEDYAVAFVDELEEPEFVHAHMTAAY